MESTYVYFKTEELPFTKEELLTLRDKVAKKICSPVKVREVLQAILRYVDGTFSFDEFTIDKLTAYYKPAFPWLTKRIMLLVMLGNDAAPDHTDPRRFPNTKTFLEKKPLKDEIMESLASSLSGKDVELCYVPVKGERRNYRVLVYFGRCAQTLREQKKAKREEKEVVEKKTAVESALVEPVEAPKATELTADERILAEANKIGNTLAIELMQALYRTAREMNLDMKKVPVAFKEAMVVLAADFCDNFEERYSPSS